MELSTEMDIKEFLGLQEIKNFKNLQEAYLHLKKEASRVIADILDHDEELKNNLVYLATDYNRTIYTKDIKIVEEKDKDPEMLIELSHVFFYINYGCGNIHLILNLNNYFKDKEDIVYAAFVFSNDGQDADYMEELSGEQHLDLDIPDIVFFRHLPVLYMLSQFELASNILYATSQREYSTAKYEHIDIKTGKVCKDEEL